MWYFGSGIGMYCEDDIGVIVTEWQCGVLWEWHWNVLKRHWSAS